MKYALERYVRSSGADLWTTSCGRGPAIVLCHGGPGLFDYLEPVANLLPRAMQVIRYEQRGCGRSSDLPPNTVEQAVADLDAVRAAYDLDDWVVLGHSWGANLGLCYAMAHPEHTRALVYVAGAGATATWRPGYRRVLMRRLPKEVRRQLTRLQTAHKKAQPGRERDCVRGKMLALVTRAEFADPSCLPDRFFAGRFPNDRVNNALDSDWVHLVTDDPDFLAGVIHLELPVLIIDGAKDPRPSSGSEQLLGMLERARRVVLQDAGHYPWYEAPDAFSAHLGRFLSAFVGRVPPR